MLLLSLIAVPYKVHIFFLKNKYSIKSMDVKEVKNTWEELRSRERI